MVPCRRCRTQDYQRLQTSTLATHHNGHPDVPTPQCVCWRLLLPACQLRLQYSIPWRWEPGLLGNIQKPWTVVQLKGNSQFLLSPLERRHQPGPGLASFGKDSRLPDRHVLRKLSGSQHQPSLIMPPRFKVSACSDLVQRWNFCKADWMRFCLLTDESIERLPPPDTLNIESHTKIFTRACY